MSIQALSPVRLTPVRFGNDSAKTYDESDPVLDPNQLVGEQGKLTGTTFDEFRDQIQQKPKDNQANQPPSATSRQGRYIAAGNHFKGFLKSVGIALGGSVLAGAGILAAGTSGKLGKYAALPLLIGGVVLSAYGALMSKYHQLTGIYQAVRGVFAKNAEQPAQ
jgi:hypothetical protein